ncbi:MAG: COG4315 family predicted lipoprotein [Solirubrobacterales bacterium]
MLAIGAICAALVLVACGDDDEPAPDEPTTPVVGSEDAESAVEDATASGSEDGGGQGGGGSSKPGIEITTADSQFGDVLFDSDRRAIYYFDKESGPTSECYGDCAVAWPPVLTKGEPQAGGGAEAKLLGTTERDDGSTQVTYDGRPLYYYVDDPQGQILCHNVEEFGGLWLAVEPGGAPVS